MLNLSRITATIVFIIAATGCASSKNAHDPFERFNRAMFTFNDTVDKAALKPVAVAYRAVTPSVVRVGIGNFFGNLNDAWSSVNNFLQGKVEAGGSDLLRFSINSVLGFGGLLDIASEAGLQKHAEDFGQTLGYWGVAPGPYIVLPIFGPSTLRDTIALPFDLAADPLNYYTYLGTRAFGTTVRLIDQRAELLDASNLLEDIALDRYEFVRDAYLQRRASRVFNGESAEPKNGE